jgi:biopolymer transport protein ExbB
MAQDAGGTGAEPPRTPLAAPARTPSPPVVKSSAEAPAPMASVGPKTSLMQVYRSGGSLMHVLAAMSFVAVAMVAYFFAVLRPSQIAPPVLVRELREKIRAGALDDARRAAEYRSCPLSSVAIVALTYVREAAEPDPMLLKDVVEGEGVRQAEAIQGQTQYLLDVAVVAPMVGLLGTVIGMYVAFGAVASDIASARPVVLAQGVQLALITTVFGLIVAIPAMAFYAYFRRRASKLVSYLESVSTDILTALLSRR